MLKDFLKFPKLYQAFQNLIGSRNGRTYLAENFYEVRANDRILDLGCGPADILEFLPTGVDYYGVDMSNRYIQSATKRFGNRGKFICSSFQDFKSQSSIQFDKVFCNGLLHHLSNDEIEKLFSLIKAVLKPGGFFYSVDPVFLSKSHPIATMLIRMDRGEYVREESSYKSIAEKFFSNVQSTVKTDLINIPYNHLLMKCKN